MSIRKGNSIIAGIPNDVINTKANVSLNNLDSTGKNISNWSSNVTNCITEITQDIKVEVGGTNRVILKSGSKVYIPNGVGVFNEVTIQSDVSGARNAADCLVFYDNTNGTVRVRAKSEICVGTSDSLSGTAGHCWYDTTNNLIKYYSDSSTTVTGYLSLPVGAAHGSSTFVDTIDQIFNGFGYIDSTVFVLPGLKGLIPDGRNANGTLKNTEITINTVQTLIPTSSLSLDVSVILEPQTRQIAYCGDPIYNEAENLTYDSTTKRPYCEIGRATLQASKITSFTPKTAFHAVD